MVVLVLDVGGLPADQIAPYYRSLGGGDDIAYAPEAGQVAQRYGVLFLGTTVIIGRDGTETYRDGGVTPVEKLMAAVLEAS